MSEESDPGITYAAPIATLVHWISFLADANILEETDAPVSAICIKELALRRSMIIYSMLVAKG